MYNCTSSFSNPNPSWPVLGPDKTADKNNNGCKTKLKLYVKQDYSAT